MIGMREILRHFANVSVNDVVGMRAPFLKPGRNTQYKVSTYTHTDTQTYSWLLVGRAYKRIAAGSEQATQQVHC